MRPAKHAPRPLAIGYHRHATASETAANLASIRACATGEGLDLVAVYADPPTGRRGIHAALGTLENNPVVRYFLVPDGYQLNEGDKELADRIVTVLARRAITLVLTGKGDDR